MDDDDDDDDDDDYQMNEKNTYTLDGFKRGRGANDLLSCRQILNILVFIGFMVNYMLRVNLTIAVVEMVIKHPYSPPSNTNQSQTVVGPPSSIADSNRTIRNILVGVTRIGADVDVGVGVGVGVGVDVDVAHTNTYRPTTNNNIVDLAYPYMKGKPAPFIFTDNLGGNSLYSASSLVANETSDSETSRINRDTLLLATSFPTISKTNISHTHNNTPPLLDNYTTIKMESKNDHTFVQRFNWSEADQGYLIGSFFWGYIISEIPGGRLSEMIGPRKVFGYATMAASVLTLITPLCAKINFGVLLVCRVALGLFMGPTWPAVLPLAAKWIPADERGKFLSNMMASTLGAAVTLPICGFIMASLSWEYVFYITGVVGFIWSISWFLLVYDSPAQHPRISDEERYYIESKLGIKNIRTFMSSSSSSSSTTPAKHGRITHLYKDNSDTGGGGGDGGGSSSSSINQVVGLVRERETTTKNESCLSDSELNDVADIHNQQVSNTIIIPLEEYADKAAAAAAAAAVAVAVAMETEAGVIKNDDDVNGTACLEDKDVHASKPMLHHLSSGSFSKLPHRSDIGIAAKNAKIAKNKRNKSTTEGSRSGSESVSAPWSAMLTSMPVWAFVLTHACSVFGYFTVTNQLPTYMKYMLHYNIKQNGLLSSLPYIAKYITALIGGLLADSLIRSSKLPRHLVRKLFTIIGVGIPGLIMIGQVFVGHDELWSIVVFTLVLFFNGFVTGGYLGNSLEIAPNYSGTVFGVANMFSGLCGTLSALIVGFLTNHNQVYGQWQKVFAVTAALYFFGAFTFLICGSTYPQPWNTPPSPPPPQESDKKNKQNKNKNSNKNKKYAYNTASISVYGTDGR